MKVELGGICVMLENMYIEYSPIDNIQKMIEDNDDLIVGTLQFYLLGEEHVVADFISSNAPVVCHIETDLRGMAAYEKALQFGYTSDINEIEIDEEDVGSWMFRRVREEI